ncbi:unnamed protein product [Gadus morhua 'NCC']
MFFFGAQTQLLNRDRSWCTEERTEYISAPLQPLQGKIYHSGRRSAATPQALNSAGPEMEPSEQEEEASGSRPELALMVSASRRLHQQGPPPRIQSSVAAGILPPPPSSPPKQGPPYLSTQRTHTTCCAGTLTHSRQGQAHAPERSELTGGCPASL